MRVLIANPPCRIEIDSKTERYFVRSGSRWPFSIEKAKSARPDYVPFPFFLAYGAALMEQERHEVHVLDSVALNQDKASFLNKTKDLRPELLLFETTTPTIAEDIKLIRDIKEALPTIVALAGTHATVFPEEVMASSRADYILRGEYELTFRELVRHMDSGAPADALADINGLVFRKGGCVCVNQDRELIQPLDQLPHPAFHLFPSNDRHDLSYYWDGFCQHKPAVQLHSSRGCPFRCDFCLWNQVMYRNGRYRMFSPHRVVDEMELAKTKFGAKEVYFDDDSFTIDRDHVIRVCDEIKKRGLTIKWSCMADAICCDEEMVDAMADSGCIGMKFGVESADREILRQVGKPLEYDKLDKLLKACVRRRIKTHATFTFGLSGETRQSMRKTMEFAQSLDADSVQFSITTPFPGTRYYAGLKEKGMLVAESWNEFDGAGKSVASYSGLTSGEVEDFCRQASSRWLRHKLKDLYWLRRQLVNLNRVRKGQGFAGLLKRILRIAQLIKSAA